jgi:hypothetical protein
MKEKYQKIEKIDDKIALKKMIERNLTKCMICKSECKDNLILKDASLLDLNGDVAEWKLCPECFDAWANHDFDKLYPRLNNKNI